MTDAMTRKLTTRLRPPRRGGVLFVCLLVWTALVGVGLWWLLRRDSGPSVVIFHEGDALQPAVSDKFRAWFKADLGLQRIYPWILFGPYAALVAWCFPLERGRLRLSLALNLIACAAFVTASHALNARIGISGARVIIVSSQHQVRLPGEGTGTNTTYIKINKGEAPNLLEEQPVFPLPQPRDNEPGSPRQQSQPFSNLGQSNVLVKSGLPWTPPPGAPKFGVLGLFLDLLAYSAILGFAHSIYFYQRFRERENRTLILESGLANARLGALRAQLQPHFLFNSLNAIAALLRRDPRLAEATFMSLSELLRLALSQSERQEVALREELNLVQRYLEIQQTRFGEKLRVEQDIETAALDCQVPTLLLQPLVENAIRHGLEPAENAGLVRLTAHRNAGRLILTVEDDGVGPAKSTDNQPEQSPGLPMNGGGIGLKNLSARLQTLYGDNQKLELAPRAEGGAIVRVEIPWCTRAEMEKSPASNSP
jgi:two-component sensor histidine kinase